MQLKEEAMYIDERDYEQYCFLLPAGSRFGKNKNRFIREQMTKQHPCYSESCCYDFKYTLLRGKLAARIVVMEKSVLACYRMNRKDKNLVIKNARTSRDERVFQSSARFLAYIPILLLLVLLPAFLPRSEKQLMPPEPEPQKEFLSITRFLPELFFILTQENGRITSFEYFYGPREEKAEIGIAGVYPESIQASISLDQDELIVFSPITFNEFLPSFSFAVSKPAEGRNYVTPAGYAESASILPRIRNAVLNAQGILFRENIEKNEIECFIPFEQLGAFLSELENLENSSDFAAGYVRIAEDAEKYGVMAAVSFFYRSETTAVKTDGIDLLFLSNYSGLFKIKKTETVAEKKSNSASTSSIKNTSAAYKKVGSIIKNGTVVTEFLKTEEGKIIRRDKE
jgi:hypothetical protein